MHNVQDIISIEDLGDGESKVVYQNQDVYIGILKDGKRHGLGTLTCSYDGCKYRGNWENDLQNGWGIYTDTFGETHAGIWQNGKKHGESTCTWLDGSSYKGLWNHNIPTLSYNTSKAKKQNTIPTLFAQSQKIVSEKRPIKYSKDKFLPGPTQIMECVFRTEKDVQKHLKTFLQEIPKNTETIRIVLYLHGYYSNGKIFFPDVQFTVKGMNKILSAVSKAGITECRLSDHSCHGILKDIIANSTIPKGLNVKYRGLENGIESLNMLLPDDTGQSRFVQRGLEYQASESNLRKRTVKCYTNILQQTGSKKESEGNKHCICM